MSTPAGSSSWADGATARAFESAGPGDVIAGFRLERLLGRGEAGAVFEATQLSLERTVALRLIDPARYVQPDAREQLEREVNLAASIHHPGLVPLFESGEWEGGRFVAMRLVRGRTMDTADLPPGGDPLASVDAGLEAAHRAGLSHGAVRAGNVLVDGNGRAHLADLGLGRGSGPEADQERLAEMRGGLRRSAAGRRPWKAILAAALALAAVAAVVLIVTGSGDESDPTEAPAPPVPEGAEALGSSLAPGPAGPVGCGSDFGSSCVLVLGGPGGEPLRASDPGLIRSWAVRGASGQLVLRVLRSEGGGTQVTGFSQPVEISGPGPQAFPTAMALGRDEFLGVELSPGASVGRRSRGDGALRWLGTGRPLPPIGDAAPVTGEILVRVDVEPGASPPAPDQLAGAAARGAPRGEAISELTVAVTPDRALRVVLVRTDDGIDLDSFRGPDRTARLALADLDPDGDLEFFQQDCGFQGAICLRWRNPGDQLPVTHVFDVAPEGRFRVVG